MVRILDLAKNITANIAGNVVITFAIAMMPVMLSVGAAIDYSRGSNLHSKVAQSTDAALLAAVAAVMYEVDLDDTTAVNKRLNSEFEPFFLANLYNAHSYKYNGFTIKFDPVTKGVSVDVKVDYQTALFGLVGVKSWEANVFAATKLETKVGGAISMFLVLDRSGSMKLDNGDGNTKMESLKSAVAKMIAGLAKSDPKQRYIRLGAVAYDLRLWGEQRLDWDLTRTDDYVQSMSAGGGTDSSDAVHRAYIRLKDPVEQIYHNNKSGQKPKLVMIFMTDGNNNYTIGDVSTINTCDRAKSYGIEIYTVAFQAPEKGKGLLNNCASSSAHYFQPESSDELIDAFRFIGKMVAEKLVLAR